MLFVPAKTEREVFLIQDYQIGTYKLKTLHIGTHKQCTSNCPPQDWLGL